jgi:phosphohistidine phosphatase
MKRYLYIVRHARAEDGMSFFKDFERELVTSGIMDAARMGKYLSNNGLKPDLMISSAAARAYQTAQIMAEQLGYDKDQIKSTRELYDGGSRAYLEAINKAPDSCESVMLFGHNPDVTFFSEYLTNANIGSMSKGSVVKVEFENLSWAEISGRAGKFISYNSPKELKN